MIRIKKNMMIALFVLSLFLIIFLAHLLVFLFIKNNFFSASELGSRYLGWLFFFLSFSFVGSSLWIHSYSNVFSRSAYYLSGLWHGLLLNLLIAALVFFFFLALARLIGHEAPSEALAALLIFLAFSVSALGVWNVYHPVERQVSVADPVWPAVWKEKKVIHISDVHLGEVLSNSFLQKLNAKIAALDPDIIFISGDLFDGMDGGFEVLKPDLAKLKAKEGVFFVSGNHETYPKNFDIKEILSGTDIRILDDELVDLDGVQIVGVSYPALGENKTIGDTFRNMKNYDAAKPSILLFHVPENLGVLKDLGIDLMLSGHTHRGQMWPFNLITNAMFKGADHGLLQDGDFRIYTSSGVGVWGPTMRTSSRGEIVVLQF
jgi:predicted MPP superfamily phosphohydrolase